MDKLVMKKQMPGLLGYGYLASEGGTAEWGADPQGLRAAARRENNDHLHSPRS